MDQFAMNLRVCETDQPRSELSILTKNCVYLYSNGVWQYDPQCRVTADTVPEFVLSHVPAHRISSDVAGVNCRDNDSRGLGFTHLVCVQITSITDQHDKVGINVEKCNNKNSYHETIMKQPTRILQLIIASLSLLIAITSVASSQIESFLLLSHDVRTQSMGGSSAALSDAPGTILRNPASLGSIADPTGIISISKPTFDDIYSSAGVALPLGDGGGVIAGYLDYGVATEFQQTFENGQLGAIFREGPYIVAGLGWGIELQSVATIGARGRVIHTSFSSTSENDVMKERSTSLAFDLGTQIALDPLSHLLGLPNKRCNLGVAVSNIGPPLHIGSSELALPTVATRCKNRPR